MKKIYYFLLITFLFMGCANTSSDIKVKGKESGEIIIDCNLDQNILGKFSSITPGYFIASVNSSKKDFLFVVEYSFTFNLGQNEKSSIPVDFPLEFYIKVPGKIIKSNAQKIEYNTATWKFNRGEEVFNLALKSRYIRWYLIILIPILVIIFKMRYIKKSLLR